MKKYFLLILFILVSSLGSSFAIESFDDEPSVYTRDQNQVVDTNGIDDPLRSGTDNIAGKVKGIVNDQITNSGQAQSDTLNFIKGVINYFLGLLAFVSLIYLLYHGFLMVTAAGDEAKYKKGFQGLRIAVTALIMIGVSWFVVSIIISVIKKIAF